MFRIGLVSYIKYILNGSLQRESCFVNVESVEKRKREEAAGALWKLSNKTSTKNTITMCGGASETLVIYVLFDVRVLVDYYSNVHSTL